MGPKLEPAAATSSRNSGTSVRLYHWLLDYHAPALSVWADFEIDYSSAFSFRCVFSCFDLWQTDMKLVSNSMWVFPFFRFSALVGHIQKTVRLWEVCAGCRCCRSVLHWAERSPTSVTLRDLCQIGLDRNLVLHMVPEVRFLSQHFR